MSKLKCVPGAQLAYTATTIALAISKEFDNEDMNILSSFFNAIGDNLGIIASQQEALKSCKDKSEDKNE